MKKEVNVLQTDSNELITGNTNILNFCRDYFSKLYKVTDNDLAHTRHSPCKEFLRNIDFPKLTDEDRALTDAPITSRECKEALDDMANNKSPSVSGFSKEFFQFFWLDLETILMNYINQAKSKGLLRGLSVSDILGNNSTVDFKRVLAYLTEIGFDIIYNPRRT